MDWGLTMQPHFSIITPVFNGHNEIDNYVSCLKRQTFQDWEAIVVDDGSTDDTYIRLKQATNNDKRFNIIKNDFARVVAGPYQARNKALSLCRGDYICFLDIDDIWLPNKLNSQAKILEEQPNLKLIFSAYMRVVRQSEKVYIRKAPGILPIHVWINILNPVPMLTSCVHSKAIQGLNFMAVNHEDYIFWHQVIQRLKGSQIRVQPEVLAAYSIHEGSVSSNKLKAAMWILLCYRQIGHTWPLALMALIARGIIQIVMQVEPLLPRGRRLYDPRKTYE